MKTLGKFEGNGNLALVSAYVSESTDEELGEVDGFGWFGKFEGKIKGHGPFFAICHEDNQGFVDVDWFDNHNKLEAAWVEIETAYERFENNIDI